MGPRGITNKGICLYKQTWIATLLLCVCFQAAANAEAAVAGTQVKPSASTPKSLDSAMCVRVLPGCQSCLLYTLNSTATKPAFKVQATSTDKDLLHSRKVYVCTKCRNGFIWAGTRNPYDANPGHCKPDPDALPCTTPPPPDSAPNSRGFRHCPSALGATCRTECSAGATGPGYIATCLYNGGYGAWDVSGSCTAGPAPTCPAAPPTPKNAKTFTNCQTAVGSTCNTTCTAGAKGTGYNAVCKASKGVASWKVAGACIQEVTVLNCKGSCGVKGLRDQATNRTCYCDYWCNLYDDCCGGVNPARAAQSKDAYCPEMAPEANLTRVTTCSVKRGVLADVGRCSEYRPGGCWCDDYCCAAGDCCSDCPPECAGSQCPANQPKRPATTAAFRGAFATSDLGACGFGETSIAAFRSADTEGFETATQRCQDALIQTDMSAQYVDIPIIGVNTVINGTGAGYSEDKFDRVLAIVNMAFRRAGIVLTKHGFAPNTTFSTVDELTHAELYCSNSTKCRRCQVYNDLVQPVKQKVSLLHSQVAVVYMKPFPVDPKNKKGPSKLTLGAAFKPQGIYQPSPKGNEYANSCIDGVWVLATTADWAGSVAAAEALDAATIVHELGHWLGLNHVWNENYTTANATKNCNAQTGTNHNGVESINSRDNDGVRDTPPQLPNLQNATQGKVTPLFFGCDPDGIFDPKSPIRQGPALSCNDNTFQYPKTAKYLNNFYNVMAYYRKGCAYAQRLRTFTPGQIARMSCVWRCYRLNECGTGVFPFLGAN